MRTNASNTVQLFSLNQCSFFSISVSKRPKERHIVLNITGFSLEPWKETFLYISIGTGAEPEEIGWKKKKYF